MTEASRSYIKLTIAGALTLALMTSAHAQEPELLARARSQLAARDTTAALAKLRELTTERPDFAPGWGLLGEVLTARASSVDTDFRDRREAEKALSRALELDADNPLYLFTFGRLKRKQQIYLDSRRLLDRAVGKLEGSKGDLQPAQAAELWFQRGLFYEDAYLDTRHLVFAPDLPVAGTCAVAPTFCLNFSDPAAFNEHLARSAELSEYGEDDYEGMVEAFERALEADPSHTGAFRRLAIHLLDRGDLSDVQRLARRYTEAAPGEPWSHIVLGIVHHRAGRDSLAEASFDRGLALAPPQIAAHYRDVGPVLREKQAEEYRRMNGAARRRMEAVLWRKSDPLYLTDENEVRVAHLARVSYADLMFEDPTRGIWGSETERGRIYVRYGPPERSFALRREGGRETSALELAEAFSAVTSGQTWSDTDISVGGRWIFWNYGLQVPNFIFAKPLRWRHASHLGSSYSAAFDEGLRELQPAVYETGYDIHDYPVQAARFRGEADSIVELDLYTRVPTGRLLERVSADSIHLGLFVFAGPEHTPVYERRFGLPAKAGRGGGQALTYTLPMPPGRFSVSLEAQAAAAAAVQRADIELAPYRAGRLALSDLVLAYTVAPTTERPSGRRDFAIRENPELAYEWGQPVALYWEVYGLRPDEEGLARYRITLGVESAEGSNVLARVVGALGDLVGLSGEEEPELSFDRVAELRSDRMPEFLSLELSIERPGQYRVRIEVLDQVSGTTAVNERVFEYRRESES